MRLIDDIVLSRGPAAAFAVMGLYWGAFAALVPDLKAQIGASDGVFGLALFVSASGAVASMWLAPRVGEILGKRAMSFGALAMAVAFLLPGATGGAAGFALAMLLCAAASGILDVIMNAQVSRIEARENAALMNLNHAIFSFGYALAAILTGLAREAGFAATPVFAVFGLATIALAPLMRGDTLPAKGQSGTEKIRLPVSLVVLAGLVVLIAFLAEQATEGWSALHLERSLGAGAAEGALGPAILGLTMGVGRLFGQTLIRYLSELSLIRWGGILGAAGVALAALTENLLFAYLGFAILGIGVSVVAPMAFALIGRAVTDEQRTLAISRVAVLGYAGFFVGPPMMGVLAELWGISASFLAVSAGLLLMGLPLVALIRRNPDSQPGSEPR